MAFERISLNIIPEGEMPVFHASQFDAGRPIIIDLYNGDDAYTPAAGVTFELHCRKVDDNIVTLDTYEVDGNTLTFASTEQLCACSGDNLCEVAIMLDELLMGTLNFILHVERDPLAGGLTSETSIYNLTQQIDDIISGEGYVKDTDLDVLQSDWNEDDPTSPAYIKNKPGPSTYEQADWTENDPSAQSYIKHKPDLKEVATSGSYNDLTDKPTIPAAQVNSDWNASSGVAEILNKPTIPTKTSELTNDSGYVESSDLAAVATTGDYDDLLNKPSIPAAQVQSDWNQTNTSAVDYIKNKPILPFESKGQYLIKTTPATKRSIEFTTLIGGTCGVNQLVDTGDTSVNTISGHKYLTRINHVESIITGGSAVSINDSSEDNVIDLTQMFGTTIADYVYTLESGTSGAGITWLKNNGFFGADYYPYNAGGLLSVKTSKKINVGFNQWDEQWEYINSQVTSKNYIPVLPNTVYFFGNVNLYDIEMFDVSKNSLGNPTYTAVTGGFLFTTASNCAFIKFSVANSYGTTYNNDICINISDANKNGTYEPYVSHEYPLDGNRKVHRVFGVDTVNQYDILDTSGYGYTNIVYAIFSKPATSKDNGYASTNLICKYPSRNDINNWDSADKIGYIFGGADYNKYWVGFPFGTSLADMKTALADMPFVYELATPFDETVSNPELRGVLKLDSNNNLYYYGDTCSDFTNPMQVDGNGTEEFVDGRTVEMPVGHDTFYIPMN